ncbi:hypothetical protein VTJ83DRAFT_105 [Remersonia thermophila]|uniref:Nineteen complex-related protein 2-domain-containing protein n=1 Tax=Remersonia thermophila TaxID=72144 RepID=A0ABR4DMG2_9PEZI
MSSFAKKKQPRIIQTLDDDEDDSMVLGGGEQGQQQDSHQPAPPERIKFGRSKPRASNLRRSIRPDHGDEASEATPATSSAGRGDTGSDGEDDASGPVVIRPSLSRPGAVKKVKKRPGASRLSFGPGASADDDDESESSSTAGGASVVRPANPAKKSLSQRLLETNALRKSASLEGPGAAGGRLPLRFAGGDDDAPKYSKEHLEELQTSTPSTPQNLGSIEIHDDHDGDWGAGTPEQQQDAAAAAADEDLQMLDASELEGAVIVPSSSAGDIIPRSARQPAAHILTEAEIRERKERRARLARETDFLSLEDDDPNHDSDSGGGGGARVASFPSRKKKPESRLMAEDEDLGEGYDEFVSDGGLALGRKAEREAKRRQRQEMADLIRAAEGGSDDDGGGGGQDESDSEAERLAAYEAAQRRAGLEGLRRTGGDDGRLPPDLDDPDAVPRMKPLPKLHEVLQRMRDLVRGIEDQVALKRARIGDLERERDEILAREKEVQEILDQAAQKYQAAVASVGGPAVDVKRMVSSVGQSPMRPLPPGIAAGEVPLERGLESFGATPTRRDDGDEMM